jgi:sugar lactone lactonase YvrE
VPALEDRVTGSATVSMWRRWALALAFLVAVTQLVGASAADALVYWTNYSTNTIGRANLDGTGANQAFIAGVSGPVGIAVDGAHIYWANYGGTGTIGRANLDGSGVDQGFVAGASGPAGMAVDAAHVYWTNYSGGTIGRANLDGSAADQSFIPGISSPEGITVDGAHVYWVNSGTSSIGRANLDGSAPDPNFIPGSSGTWGELAVDAAHIYWTNPSTNTVGRANLDGTGVNQSFIAGSLNPYGIAVDGAHLYWGNFGNNTIGRANLDGSAPDQAFIGDAGGPAGLAVNAVAGAVSPPPPPPPVLGRTINVSLRSGRVLVKTPGAKRFFPLTGDQQVVIGTEFDTSRGRLNLCSARDASGSPQCADVYEGSFRTAQSRSAGGLTDLILTGGNFRTCKHGRGARRAVSAARGRRKARSVRHLWGNGRGNFRTVGRYSAATVRGTSWVTNDRCDGTLTRVRTGSVSVRDLKRKRTVVVRAGRSYLARA